MDWTWFSYGLLIGCLVGGSLGGMISAMLMSRDDEIADVAPHQFSTQILVRSAANDRH